jgi:hypothetical protein
MKEKDIRPDSLMCENDELFAKDVQKMLKRRSEFAAIPCPACGSSN